MPANTANKKNDFAFLARQKRITIDDRDYYIDYSDSQIIPILSQPGSKYICL